MKNKFFNSSSLGVLLGILCGGCILLLSLAHDKECYDNLDKKITNNQPVSCNGKYLESYKIIEEDKIVDLKFNNIYFKYECR